MGVGSSSSAVELSARAPTSLSPPLPPPPLRHLSLPRSANNSQWQVETCLAAQFFFRTSALFSSPFFRDNRAASYVVVRSKWMERARIYVPTTSYIALVFARSTSVRVTGGRSKREREEREGGQAEQLVVSLSSFLPLSPPYQQCWSIVV